MTSSLIDTLDLAAIILNRWIVLAIFITGIIGNSINIIIFSRGIFVKQSCSLYFLAASVNNLVMFFIGLLTRMLDDGFQLDIFDGASNVYCKIRTYLVYTLFAISSWYFVCASIDRLYSTNQSALKRQKICSTRMAIQCIGLTIVSCLLVHIHVLVYYQYFYKLDVHNQLSWTCTTNDTTYNMFFAIFMLNFYSLLPPLLMSILGILTLKNIRQSRILVNPSTMTPIPVRRDKQQLIKSLSVQILVLSILTIPHSCYWMYIAFTSTQSSAKSVSVRAWEKFILHIVRVLLYVNYGSSFYIQLCISKTFRREFVKIVDNITRHWRNFF
ncbi:unnamed protein product [Adineta ricciae]|uniref:G-protein coupled receptors family 1 profile domain-containing protein n=1 Tax=Adineta ricciae TaxID=249248 RepID=A0A815DE10_ADIRI|nr:unnamed protein product [Adineta ricciae]CAF1299594.1 unnamed protein product [Adineta ricciae]